MKKVIVAKPHGYCGGVQHAIQTAQGAARENPGKTFILGDLVHNKHVVSWLKDQGVKTVHSLDEIENPWGATLVIRAHGAVPKTYQETEKRGLKIVDGTCPLVAQVHQKVKELVKQGKHILYLASEVTHDEAVGVAGQVPEGSITMTTLEELDKVAIPEPENTVVLTQTTLSTLETEKALKRLKGKYPELTIEPHICPATTQRQEAVIELAKKVNFVIIVGSLTSSNSKRLREVAEAVGAQAYIVDTAEELDPSWLEGVTTIGVSSGASTPEWLLEEVIEKIKKL